MTRRDAATISEWPGPAGETLSDEHVLEVLAHGELEIEGQLTDASNITLRGVVSLAGTTLPCVHKPIRGERPLWDFPTGTLAHREAAAYLVSAATGWHIVPPTVTRTGPFGVGSCQLWVDQPSDADAAVDFIAADSPRPDWLPVAAARDEAGNAYLLAHVDDPHLAQVALFDAVVNNADRKGGHLLRTAGGRLAGIDHGVCFHEQDKLRTVLWGWVGQEIHSTDVATLTTLRNHLAGDIGRRLATMITPVEVSATQARLDRLLVAGVFPEPGEGWPPVPWPPIA